MKYARIENNFFKSIQEEEDRGRPGTRWVDDVEEELRIMDVLTWKRVADYRNQWRQLVKETKVLQGL